MFLTIRQLFAVKSYQTEITTSDNILGNWEHTIFQGVVLLSLTLLTYTAVCGSGHFDRSITVAECNALLY